MVVYREPNIGWVSAPRSLQTKIQQREAAEKVGKEWCQGERERIRIHFRSVPCSGGFQSAKDLTETVPVKAGHEIEKGRHHVLYMLWEVIPGKRGR